MFTPDDQKPGASPGIKQPQPASSRRRLITIAVDAGHAGRIRAPGTPRHPRKTRHPYDRAQVEVLDRREPKMRAMLTRDGDYVIELKARVEKRAGKADLFVVGPGPTLSSSPTFVARRYLPLSERGASSTAAQWLASGENRGRLDRGINTTRKRDRLTLK